MGIISPGRAGACLVSARGVPFCLPSTFRQPLLLVSLPHPCPVHSIKSVFAVFCFSYREGDPAMVSRKFPPGPRGPRPIPLRPLLAHTPPSRWKSLCVADIYLSERSPRFQLIWKLICTGERIPLGSCTWQTKALVACSIPSSLLGSSLSRA